jgi:hypothetical protein
MLKQPPAPPAPEKSEKKADEKPGKEMSTEDLLESLTVDFDPSLIKFETCSALLKPQRRSRPKEREESQES